MTIVDQFRMLAARNAKKYYKRKTGDAAGSEPADGDKPPKKPRVTASSKAKAKAKAKAGTK